MQLLDEGILREHAFAFLRARENVDCSRIGIDDRSRRDSNLRSDKRALHVAGGERLYSVGEKAGLPQWLRRSIGIERIDAVVLGSNEQDIVLAFAWNLDSAKVERLRVNIAIDLQGEQLAEMARAHRSRRELSLVQVGSRSRRVVL